MSYGQPYITWTDDDGTWTLRSLGPGLQNWSPDQDKVADRETALGTGRRFLYLFRKEFFVKFDMTNINASETGLALRLLSWLDDGGEATLHTFDSADRVYTIFIHEGFDIKGALVLADTKNMEYTLHLEVVNTLVEPTLYIPGGASAQRLASLTWSVNPVALGAAVVDDTVTVLDTAGLPIPGLALTITSSNPAKFTVSPTSGVTDANGQLLVALTGVADGTGLTLSAVSGSAHGDAVVNVALTSAYIPSPLPLIWNKRDTLMALANNAPVTGWHDSGPNGWDLIPDTSDPSWDSVTLGGCVKFDRTFVEGLKNDLFDGVRGSAGFTLFYVCQALLGGGALLTCPGNFIYGYNSAGYFQFTEAGLAWRAKFVFTFSAASHVFALRYNGAGVGNSGRVQQYVDGALQAGVFDGTIPASLTAVDGIILGDGVGVGFSNQNTVEHIIYPGALSDADVATVTAALRAKYGI